MLGMRGSIVKHIAILTTLALTTPALADPALSTWHLLTQTESGSMQLQKGLTQHECEFMKHRALGQPATDEEIAAEKARIAEQMRLADEYRHKKEAECRVKHPDVPGDKNCVLSVEGDKSAYVYGISGLVHMINPSDIKSAECFE